MKTILVPTDFSAEAEKACAYAAALAKDMGARVHLLHVYAEAVAALTAPVAIDDAEMDTRHQHEHRMNKKIEDLGAQYSIAIDGNVRQGFTTDTIYLMAKELDAGLIVMGTKRTGSHRTAGSNSLKVIRKSGVPVLIVPGHVTYKPVKNVVLAIDFEEMVTAESFDVLFEVVKIFDAALRVVHVVPKGSEPQLAELDEKLQLGRVLSKASFQYDKIESDDVEQAITSFVEAHPADWLVMLAHYHNVFERMFGHAYTRSVPFEINIPLLVLKNR